MTRRLGLALLPLALAACATTGKDSKPTLTHHPLPPSQQQVRVRPPKVSPYAPAQEDLSKRGDYVAGGLFRPGVADTVPDHIPDVDAIPEPEVRDEPRARTGNKDYAVLGQRYDVLDDAHGFVEEGQASYYGNKFHGRRTSSQEVYDMYAFTAAHKTLPLPSFARVTNLDNGKSVVVRVNDRGPFHRGRVIDLSYAAAVKLGYRDRGTARVRVEALRPGDHAEGPVVATARAVTKLPPPTTPAPPSADPPRSTDVTLQVASFGNVENARQALSLLQGAAIVSAQLQDVDIGGKKIWRLRIGPVSEALTSELAARVVGLGFAQPQRVRE